MNYAHNPMLAMIAIHKEIIRTGYAMKDLTVYTKRSDIPSTLKARTYFRSWPAAEVNKLKPVAVYRTPKRDQMLYEAAARYNLKRIA